MTVVASAPVNTVTPTVTGAVTRGLTSATSWWCRFSAGRLDGLSPPDEALDEVPVELLSLMNNVVFLVEDAPADGGDDLLGL